MSVCYIVGAGANGRGWEWGGLGHVIACNYGAGLVLGTNRTHLIDWLVADSGCPHTYWWQQLYWRPNIKRVFSVEVARKCAHICPPAFTFTQSRVLDPPYDLSDPNEYSWGATSICQGLQRAYHLGYTDLRLVGADFMGGRYWDGRLVYPERQNTTWDHIERAQGFVDWLKSQGISVRAETLTALRL